MWMRDTQLYCHNCGPNIDHMSKTCPVVTVPVDKHGASAYNVMGGRILPMPGVIKQAKALLATIPGKKAGR